MIWKLDLSFSHTTKAPERVMSYHAGQVNAIGVSPVSQLVASVADDSKYDEAMSSNRTTIWSKEQGSLLLCNVN